MSRIQLLPDQIINLIAAGEVIERPASVVKELVENSLDAGATRVTIETLGAGRDLIRISDNGEGIAREELPLAVKRHATSKLSSVDELWHLETLGFRGEALASIAEVSRVLLISRTPQCDTGYSLTVEGGKASEVQAVGTAPGTRVTVEDLFYNTPARAKYLKTQTGENRQIIKVVQDLALANPGISFTLVVEGQTRVKTPGNSRPLETAAAVLGSDFAAKLREVEFGNGFGRVTGWLGQVGHYTSTRSQQVFSVNGRVFQHAPFGYVVENAYKGSLPVRRFPVFALDISVDAASVDVNVHPAKQEVKFQHETEIRSLIYHAVKASLSHQSAQRQITAPTIDCQEPRIIEPLIRVSYSQPEPQRESEVTVAPVLHEPGNTHPFSYLGQIDDTYLVWEYQGDLVLMDQHAAHERILFEEILGGLSKGQLNRQELLFPQTLHLSGADTETVWGAREGLERFGFALEEFGSNCLLLRGLPVLLAGTPAETELQKTILELAAAFEGNADTTKSLEDYYWQAAQVGACHGAIRAGQRLDTVQARKLISDWLSLGIPTCPHGRPIIKRFNPADLAKLFLRS